MKKKQIILVIIIFLLLIIFTIKNNGNIIKEKQIIKEMTEAEYDGQITELNKSHSDYASYVQSCKETIAEAITNKGVETSSDSTVEVMAENIKKISASKFFVDQIAITGQWEGKQFDCAYVFDSTEFSELSFDIFAGYNGAYVKLYASIDGTNYTELQTWTESGTGNFNIDSYIKVKFYLYAVPAGGWGGCSVTNITMQ